MVRSQRRGRPCLPRPSEHPAPEPVPGDAWGRLLEVARATFEHCPDPGLRAAILDGVDAGVALVGADAAVLFANREWNRGTAAPDEAVGLWNHALGILAGRTPAKRRGLPAAKRLAAGLREVLEGRRDRADLEVTLPGRGDRTCRYSACRVGPDAPPAAALLQSPVMADPRPGLFSMASDGMFQYVVNPPIPLKLPAQQRAELFLRQSRIEQCNVSFARIHGFTRSEEVRGLSFPSFMAADHETRIALCTRFFEAGCELAGIEMPLPNPAGGVTWVTSHVIGTVEHGALTAVWGVQRDITELRQSAERLRHSEGQYRRLFDTNPHPMAVIDRETLRYLAVNDAACETLGYDRRQLLTSKTALELRTPEDRELLRRSFADPAGPPVLHLSNKLHRADGSWIDVEVVAHRARFEGRDAFITTALDVTERRGMEAELRASREFLSGVINCIGDPVFVKDSEHRLVLVNDAECALAGRTPGELLGMAEDPALPRGLLQAFWRQDDEVLQSGRACVSEDRMPDATGELRSVITKKTPFTDSSGSRFVVGVMRDVTELKRAEDELLKTNSDLEAVIHASPVAIIKFDRDLVVRGWNPAATTIFGWAAEEVLETPYALVDDAQCEELRAAFETVKLGGRVYNWEIVRHRKDGTSLTAVASMAPIHDLTGEVTTVLAVIADVTEHRQLEVQLLQAHKLESIGQLAAGIAHEINTPTQYVGDNTRFLEKAFSDIAGPLRSLGPLLKAAREGAVTAELLDRLESEAGSADLEYLLEEIPTAIGQTLEGVERVSRIVRAMKDFSHPGSSEKSPTDLNRAIESTVTVARNEWKYVADLVTDFDPDLPLVPCLVSEFNQVILNLVINSAHAIGQANGETGSARGLITITTRRGDGVAEVRVQDTGTGIPEAIRDRVFDPFFTTKGVGHGTGQGLAISHQVIVKKHGGTIDFETEVGQGTTFVLRLPLGEEQPVEAEAA
jgi:PAS domain S-box-containing protein